MLSARDDVSPYTLVPDQSRAHARVYKPATRAADRNRDAKAAECEPRRRPEHRRRSVHINIYIYIYNKELTKSNINQRARTMGKPALILTTMACACALLMARARAEEELYSDKYDYVDVDKILGNERIRDQYYNCFMGVGNCVTPDAKFFRDKFPEALVTKCRKCTSKQKDSFEKIVLYYTENYPEKWNAILAKSISDFQKKKKTN